MSKKLINSPDDAVDEALAGLVCTHPGLRLLQGHRVIVRADTETVVKEEKVTLLSGGGSGHEPAHAGYVGRGMLSAAVCGAVFVSPPPGSILAALRAIRSPAGTLMIVKNYTVDQVNFGIALERAKTEGMKVTMVIVGEDCALLSSGRSAGRRGLCGTILVHKIAGAMAERGCSLEEVTSGAQDVARNIATMSVSLSSCSVPGHKPSFTLDEEEMMFGLGSHGEAGAERMKLQPANIVVERLLNHIVSREPGPQYFTAEPGMKVALVVNNLGGTSNLELSIMANSAIRYLVDSMKLSVTRVYVGSLMTSLQMAGVSLTLLKVLSDWEQLLDLPTCAPGWPTVSEGVGGDRVRVDSPPIPCTSGQAESGGEKVFEPTTTADTHMEEPSWATTEDPQFPGIHFLGTPWKETVTSEGMEISWEDIGIAFNIPPGAVPDDELLQLTVRPCLTGPFEPPFGYEFMSPTFIVSPAFDFIKDIQMVVYHFGVLESVDDCERMTFLSAPTTPVNTTPVYEGTQPQYKFTPLRGGVFQRNQHLGTISLRHFCEITTARLSRKRLLTPDKEDEAKRPKRGETAFSVRLYRNSSGPRPCTDAIFCVLLYHPLYCRHLENYLKEREPDLWRSPSIQEPVQFANTNKAILVLPKENYGYRIVPDVNILEITKEQVDIAHQRLTPSYPQKIRLSIYHPTGITPNPDMEPYKYELTVLGFKQEVSFTLIPSSARNEVANMYHRPSSSCKLESAPTMIELIVLHSNGGGRVKVLEGISTNYHDFGILLLEDNTGTQLNAIVDKFSKDAKAINREILVQWLAGKGKQPVSWNTLLEVLKDIDLQALASDIESALR